MNVPQPAGQEPGVEELRALLGRALNDLLQAVDLTVRLGAAARAEAAREWEAFLGAFFQHVRRRGRETGQNLLTWLSFSRIWR